MEEGVKMDEVKVKVNGVAGTKESERCAKLFGLGKFLSEIHRRVFKDRNTDEQVDQEGSTMGADRSITEHI